MTLARTALVVITAFVIVIFYTPLGHADYVGNWGDGTYGLTGARGGTITINSVDPGSPAARAGVRAGDMLFGEGGFSQPVLDIDYPRAGDRETFSLVHPDGRKYVVTLTAVPVAGFNTWDRATGVLAMIPATVFLIVAFALVFLRPSVMTWSFYAVATGYFSTQPAFEYFHSILPPPVFTALTFVLVTFFGNFAVLPLLPFVMRFPDDRLTGFSNVFDRAVWTAIALAFAGYSYDWYRIWATGVPRPFVTFFDVWLPLATFAVATYILIGKFKHATPAIRQRFGFLVIGMVIAFIAYAVYFVPGVPDAVKQIVGYAVVVMPVTVAYAVLRHRVLDVNFVLNRALAYGILSIFVITVVSLLDWLFSHVLSEYHLAIVFELVATIGIGLLLDRINKAIGTVVERVFFAHRRLAEKYLKRAAAALPYATEEAAVSEGLVEVPAEALRLGAAALYRRNDSGRFEGVATSQNTPVAPPGFDANHLLVRMLQSSEERVWLEQLRSHLQRENSAIYVLAIPVLVRHELVSFTLYGAHANGAQLDPDEVDLLEDLAREASRAYDHIDAVRMRERYARVMEPLPGNV
ncbi:MAG: hypothetical protein JO322_00955 [Candidatus Eremiobacteraeota bacterium]|nr:hypothetical protein [Candidatus Eremiobacteraeota bacterium]